MTKEIQLHQDNNITDNKSRDLILSIVLDLIGYATYAIPFLGEFADIVWAPVAGYLMTRIYKGFAGKLGGAGGIRYFFGDGFFLGGEISADVVYVGQDKIITSKAKDKFYETSYAFSFGKKFKSTT